MEIIFGSVCTEVASANMKRRTLARMFLVELGGENSSRLVVGGLLADLNAEHYTWVAGGDKRNPDATTVQARTEAFEARLDILYTQGLIHTQGLRSSFFRKHIITDAPTVCKQLASGIG